LEVVRRRPGPGVCHAADSAADCRNDADTSFVPKPLTAMQRHYGLSGTWPSGTTTIDPNPYIHA